MTGGRLRAAGDAGPAGAAHVYPDGRAGRTQRRSFGQVVLERPALMPGSGGAVRVDYPPPGHRAAVDGQHPAHLPGARACAQVFGDVAVRHHPPGRDRVDHVEYQAGEVVGRRRSAVVRGITVVRELTVVRGITVVRELTAVRG